MFDRKTLKDILLGSTLLSVALTGGAMAQDAENDEDEAQPADQIVVTGSRIAADNTLSAPSPVVALGAEDLQTSGEIDIGVLLREAPQLQGSLPASFSAFNGTPLGASLLNLRNLGSVRTLVIEDGRRHVSAIEGSSSVDVNTISTSLLGRVEVLTGGASAVYGADAVSGVVNFIMRDGSSFDGLEVRAQAGVSGEGDAEDFFVSLANGYESADGRGSLMFAVEYSGTEPIFAGDRDFAGTGAQSIVANNAATQAALGVDPRFSNTWIPNQTLPISSGGGVISLTGSAFVDVFLSGGVPGCDFALGSQGVPACQFYEATTGTLRPYNPGDIYIGPFQASGGDAVQTNPDNEILLPDSTRLLLQTVGEYEINEYVNFFVNAKYVATKTTESNQVNGFNDDIPISFDNPFIPVPLFNQIQQLQAEGVPVSLVMSRDNIDVAARSNPEADRKMLRIIAGFEGEIPGTDLNYEVFYNFGRTDADIESRARVEDRYFAAIDAVLDPATGEVVCRSDLDPTAVPPVSGFPAQNANFGFLTFQPGDGQCVPVNLFGDNTITPEAAEFIFQPTISRNDIEQQNFVATISGDSSAVFSLPAGPISFALGYEWREESSSFTPDSLDASGLTFGTLDSNAGPTSPSSGSYSVTEFFGEVRVPILENQPFAEMLELTGAYRYSDYDPYGETDTWTVGARWAPVSTLTFRTTYSEAVRVPNITEAFSPQFSASIGAADDPCNQNLINAGSQFREANCIALIGQSVADGTYDSTNFLSARVIGSRGGNPDLDPETAETFTVGAVWVPNGEFNGLFDGVTATVDYYDIQIDALISSLSGFAIASNCVDAPTINNQFCAAVDRDPTNGFITDFRSGFINLAAVEVSGIDWRLDYGFAAPAFLPLENPGEINVSWQGTRFLEDDETRDVSAPDEITDVLGEFGNPEWIFNLNVDWTVADFRFGWSGRYEGDQLLPGVSNNDLANDPDFIDRTDTGSSLAHDITASWYAKEDFEIYGGVRNLLDDEPFFASLSRPVGPRGRFFFIGANKTF